MPFSTAKLLSVDYSFTTVSVSEPGLFNASKFSLLFSTTHDLKDDHTEVNSFFHLTAQFLYVPVQQSLNEAQDIIAQEQIETDSAPNDSPNNRGVAANELASQDQLQQTAPSSYSFFSGFPLLSPDGEITQQFSLNEDFSGLPDFEFSNDSVQIDETNFKRDDENGNDFLNRDPVAADDSASGPEGSQGIVGDVSLNDSDLDGDFLTFELVTTVSNGDLVFNQDGTFIYTPNSNFQSEDNFTYVVSDPEGGTNTATVTITVIPVNDDPNTTGVALVNQSYLDAETITTIDVKPSFTDIDGDTLTYSATGLPVGLFIDASTGIISGTVDNSASQPNAGIYAVTVFADDGNGGTPAQTTFNIDVTNPVPTANDDTISVNEDSSMVISVLGNDSDPDGDVIEVLSTTNPANGTIVVNADNTITYTPNTNHNGGDTFTYTITDNEGGTNTATVTITVIPVNDDPNAVADSQNFAAGTIGFVNLGNVLTNDGDIDGDSLSIDSIKTADGTILTFGSNTSLTFSGMYGDFTITDTGEWSYSSTTLIANEDFFTYFVTDGSAISEEAKVSVTIRDHNAFPNADNFFLSTTNNGTTQLISIDLENNTETFIGKQKGLTFNATGFNPNDNFVYAIEYNGSPNLIKIGRDGTIINVGLIQGINPGNIDFSSGTFDGNGTYYFRNSDNDNAVYSLDVNDPTLTANFLFTVPQNLQFFDFSINPVDGLFYARTVQRDIISFDLTGNLISTTMTTRGGVILGTFFDDQGIMYLLGGGGRLFSYDTKGQSALLIPEYNVAGNIISPIDADSSFAFEVGFSFDYGVNASGAVELTYNIINPSDLMLLGLELNVSIPGSFVTISSSSLNDVTNPIQFYDLGETVRFNGIDVEANGSSTISVIIDETQLSETPTTIKSTLDGIPLYLGGVLKEADDIVISAFNGDGMKNTFSSKTTNNIFTTGDGADIIEFDTLLDHGNNIILDLSPLDTLKFENTGFINVANFENSGKVSITADNNGNVVIDLSASSGGTIVLEGIAESTYSSLVALSGQYNIVIE